MPTTLEELLGQPISNTLDDYFDTSNVGPDTGPDFSLFEDPSNVPYMDRDERNAAIDFLGQTLWSFADTGLFGVPSLLAPDEIYEDYLTPKTIPGKIGAAIGGTAGFVMGAPMKLGAKAATAVAKPFIKMAGKQTVKDIVKKTAAEVGTAAHHLQFSTKAGANILNKEIGKKLTQITHQTRWDIASKGVANNWGKTASKAIDDVVTDAQKLGQLTKKEALLLSTTFKKNIGTRPQQDFVDLLMSRYPNKFGWLAGNMIHEAAMFGMIDAAMEVSHSLHEGRAYDPMAPLWGVAVGASFGALKLLPAAGKASITGEDFKSGVRAIFSKNYFNGMKDKKLIANARMIGQTKIFNNESSLVEFKGMSIDLENPISSIMSNFGVSTEEAAIPILKAVLNSQRLKYGKQMMGAALTEDFSSTLANWRRVIAGTAVMNGRMMMQISQGAEMEPEDIATSLMIGAFLNRKGRPLTPEMNMKKMYAIRSNLHILGEPQTRMFDVFPTLGVSQFEKVNPITSEGFRALRDKAEELKFLSEISEEVETMTKDGSPSVAVSEKNFPLFRELYHWLQGASGNRHIKPLALITEKEAQKMQDTILQLKFEGEHITTLEDFQEMMMAATERIYTDTEYELAQTVHDVFNKSSIDWTVGSPSDESIGTLPAYMRIHQSIIRRAERGEVKIDGVPIDIERMHESLRKFNKLLTVNSNINKGETSTDPNRNVVEVKTEEELHHLMNSIEAGEARINKLLNTGRKSLKFDFDTVEDMQFALIQHKYKRAEESISEFFSDTANPKWNELLNVLVDSKLVSPDPESLGHFMLNDFKNITIEKVEGFKGDGEEALIKSVIGILGAKGNASLSKNTFPGEITIVPDQVAKLEAYLNKNKIVTQKELLDMVRVNLTQGIFRETMKDTKVTGGDIGVLSQLSNLAVPLARYSPLADGGVGFTVSKISAVGDATKGYYGKWIKEYNDYIDQTIKRGTNKKGSQMISEDRSVLLVDKNDIRVLRNIVSRQKAANSQNAAESLFDFVNALDPQDNLKAGIISYIHRTDRADDLLNFMMGEGFIGTKTKKDVIKYIFNKKTFSEEASRRKIAKWLSKFGVHTTDIDKMMSAADVEMDNQIDARHKGHSGTFTQQKFFSDYFPVKGLGSRIQDAEAQDTFIRNALYEADGTTRKLDMHETIINQMEVDIHGVKVPGSQLRSQHPNRYYRVLDDVQKLVALRIGTVSKPVLSVSRGEVREGVKNVQKGAYTELLDALDMPYVFVDGEMFGHMITDKDIHSRSINVFDLDSPHSTAGFNKNANVEATKLKKAFFKALKLHEWEGGAGTGVALIRFGNAKNVTAVPETSFAKVADLFNIRIYDQYYAGATDAGKARIEGMKRSLDASGTWGPVHEDAMRAIIIESMTKGRDDSRFMEYVMGTSEGLADLGKRFSLYHTPAFKKMDRDVMDALIHSVSPEDALKIAQFTARDVGFIVWNDKDMASIKGRNAQLLRDKNTSWQEMLGSRSDESAFDSISFISKDFKRILELYYGAGQRGSTVFKPIISSNGEEHLLFAKTVFIYDSDIQSQIFGKKPELDIMMTRSADKLKSAMSEQEWANASQPDRPVYIDKTVDEMLHITSQEITQKMKTIPMGKIGVSIIPDNQMKARQSYSIPNYMSMAESGEYYNAFYSDRLDKVLGVNQSSPGTMEQLSRNSMYRRLALLKLKNIDPNVTLADMQSTPEGLEGLGAHLSWAAMGGDPREMGESILMNTIKSQFLDPILSPYSQTDAGDVYGGKAVLKQNFKFRDLDPTVRIGEKENTQIKPGEIMLPNYIRDGSIDFKGKDIGLRGVDKEGNSVKIEPLLNKLWAKYDATLSKDEVAEQVKSLIETGSLGDVHEAIKIFDPEWSLGIITTRYPRTTPNDLAILRLKGFLKEEDGNTAIVNDFDVLNIFEGDYDVDEVDFFWGMNRGTWKHIDRVKRHWVNTVDKEHYKPTTPDLKLLNNGGSNDAWNQFDANNRVFKRGIGVVQKTVRLVNHVASLGVKNETTGMNDLMKYTAADGNEYSISVDYDNASFFSRTALESQLVIDYWKGVSGDIVKEMVGWRNEYLFPTMDRSVHQGEVGTLKERLQNQLKMDKGPEKNRIRIFRKFITKKDGTQEEVDLSGLDKTMLQALMSKHSKLLTLGTEVYDGSGQSKPATYENIMSISNEYFNGHMSDITKAVYLRSRTKHSKGADQADFEAIFGTEQVIRPGSSSRLINAYGKEYKENLSAEIQNEQNLLKPAFGKHTYTWFKSSPFLDGAITNAKETQKSGGDHGSVVERIYREVLHRDPFGSEGKGGKSEVMLEGGLYKEMQAAANEIMNPEAKFGDDPVARMKEILPVVVGKVNEDIKQIKYFKRMIGQLISNKELPQKVKEKRLDSMNEVIKQREANLKDMLSTEYLEKGEAKYLKSLRMVDITRDKDMIDGTIQWYTLHEMVERFQPDHDIKGFTAAISEARQLGAKYYSDWTDMGDTMPFRGTTMHDEKSMLRRMDPLDSIKDIEAELMGKLEAGFNEWQMPFIFEYAMPSRDDGTVIGVFNGNPMPVTTKASGRFKRAIRFLIEKHGTIKNKQEKQALREVLESLAQRSSAYRNYFDENFGLIPLKDQNILGALNNVPGFNKKLESTFDRYETINIEKGSFSKDIFGMGPEYDSNISFYRRLISNAFGSDVAMRYKNLEGALSYTNQLVMENNYMNPMSYFLMTENIRNELSTLGVDKAAQMGLEGTHGDIISPHANSPEIAMLMGRGDGISIKPMALLSDYRLNMLKKIIKQGMDIKTNQKRSSDISEMRREYEKTNHICSPK